MKNIKKAIVRVTGVIAAVVLLAAMAVPVYAAEAGKIGQPVRFKVTTEDGCIVFVDDCANVVKPNGAKINPTNKNGAKLSGACYVDNETHIANNLYAEIDTTFINSGMLGVRLTNREYGPVTCKLIQKMGDMTTEKEYGLGLDNWTWIRYEKSGDYSLTLSCEDHLWRNIIPVMQLDFFYSCADASCLMVSIPVYES